MKFKNDYLLIVLTGLILFVPFIGNIHLFDWDEINFAEAAREMISRGNWFDTTIDYQNFTEKPPMFFWIQAISMTIFGVNEFAARFPNVIAGILTLLLIYHIGRKLFYKDFGWLWVLTFSGSFLPSVFFKSGLIDPWFNLAMFSAIWFGFSGLQSLKNEEKFKSVPIKLLVLSGLLVGLAVMLKGPVGILLTIVPLLIYYIAGSKEKSPKIHHFILFAVSILFIPVIWYGLTAIRDGGNFLQEFLDRNIALFKTGDAGHGGPLYYHWLVVLFGVFPASVIALPAFFKQDFTPTDESKSFKKLMLILFFTVMIIFSIVKTKIIHYSSLSYFPLTFLAALVLFSSFTGKQLPKWLNYTVLSLLLLYSVILTAAPLAIANPSVIVPYLKDSFAKASVETITDPGIIMFVPAVLIIFLSVFLIKSLKNPKRLKLFYLTLFVVCYLSLQAILIIFAPTIESVSQRPVIEFYKKNASQDCYLYVGYKSYAQYFYMQKDQSLNPFLKSDPEKILQTKMDKPVFVVSKIQKAEKLRLKYNLHEMYRKGGWVFMKKEN